MDGRTSWEKPTADMSTGLELGKSDSMGSVKQIVRDVVTPEMLTNEEGTKFARGRPADGQGGMQWLDLSTLHQRDGTVQTTDDARLMETMVKSSLPEGIPWTYMVDNSGSLKVRLATETRPDNPNPTPFSAGVVREAERH